jgi:ureidoglycolate lyase
VKETDMSLASTPDEVRILELPLVKATPESLKGYGLLVDDYDAQEIEIVTWPVAGWRQCDPGTGNEGGVTEGVFEFWWRGEVLYGRNHAVNDQYQLGWSKPPSEASETTTNPDRSRILLWHANYHPDGGQLFFPLDGTPFVAPLAIGGDDIRPEDFKAFWFDGTKGLYIHPNIWHEAVFPTTGDGRFQDKQGKVHARISADFAKEHGTYLSVPLSNP